MAQSFDVVVRGAGVVGQATALLLAQARLRVGLLPAPPRAQPRLAAAMPLTGPQTALEGAASDVRAFALNAASRGLLQALRAWPGAEHCCPVTRMQVWGDEGGALEFAASSLGCEALAWIVDVPALQESLAVALRYQPLVEMLAPDAVLPKNTPLTVVSEGASSASRAQHAIEFVATKYPQQAIAARLHSTQAHGGVARQWFVSTPEGAEVLALLPLPGMGDEQPGHSLALVWSVPNERVAALLALSPAEFEQALQARCASVAQGGRGPSPSPLSDVADATAPGQLSLRSPRATWPLQRAQASRWVDDGFALVGDAAHSVHPLAGQGLNLGLADAAELARVLQARDYWRSPGDVKLLRRYERARKADVARMGFATDALERLFAHSNPRVQALRNWGMQGFARSGPLKDWVARQAMGV